jgi:hypothetical protein
MTEDIETPNIHAGQGRAVTIASLCDRYKKDGYHVVGVTHTHAAAAQMKQIGCDKVVFHHQLQGIAGSTAFWDTPKTVVIVDDHGLTASAVVSSLAEGARRHGGKLVLVGDTNMARPINGIAVNPSIDPADRDLAERRVLAVRGTYDAPGFDACVTAELAEIAANRDVGSQVPNRKPTGILPGR